MQCCVRRRAARRQLLKLKSEARSVQRYRELNRGMEVKLMQLQLKADQEVGDGGSGAGSSELTTDVDMTRPPRPEPAPL